MRLEGKTVLITGGAGFVGSHIADQLVAAGVSRVFALDNLVRGRPENLAALLDGGVVELVEGDVRDTPLLESLVKESDLVFHQAALRITHCAEDPRAAFDVMAAATFNLLEMCVRHRVEKVVAASSASVYGMAERFPTSESHHPYDNRTLYGAAKVFNEGLLRSFNDMYGLKYAALRYFNIYGPRMDIHGKYTEVLVRWMERIENGIPPLILGDGTQTMDFIDVRDVARANLLAAVADEVADEAFNVASGSETSLRELAAALCRVMGAELEPEYGPERTVNSVRRRLADTAKAQALLGFSAEIPLHQGLGELVAWWRLEKGRFA